ncbi:MAG: FAD-dependent oxidoreductase [Gammaproteobacteria bacterium]|jgi:3-phenylpropionate/trans-cinnamate dioxygenase ferredoxin reductase component|nr:FAD-dependent oxidoreductase [Gammaproteobacteria bacterium]
MESNSRFVIVGGGQAGGCAARAMREYGFEGEIILVADEAYLPYERPPLSKNVLLGKDDYQSTYINDEHWYASHNVQVKLNTRVSAIDCDRKLLTTNTGESISYDKLLLATGGRVRRLPIEGAELEGVNYLRGIDDAESLKTQMASARSLIGIGAGFITLEIAAVARTLGLDVTLLEKMPAILDRVFEHDVAERIESLHGVHGVVFRTGVNVEEIVGDKGKVTGVKLAGGEIISADVVVIGIGIIPNTELAEEAGIEVNNGIVVNEYGETSIDDVYACGDITNHYSPLYDKNMRLECWQNAQDQSAAVVQSMLGNVSSYRSVPWFWSDQYDMNLQMAGITENADESVVREDVGGGTYSKIYLKNKQIIGAIAIDTPKEIMGARKLIAKGSYMDISKLSDPKTDLRKAVNK